MSRVPSKDKIARKNYSLYMPLDFNESLEKVIENNDQLAPLSHSQAVYFIIKQLADNSVKLK